MQRPDRPELKAVFFAPAEELRDSLNIGGARVFVSDGRGEEFEEMLAGFVTGSRDNRRHRKIRCRHGGDNLDARFAHKCKFDVIAEPDAA